MIKVAHDEGRVSSVIIIIKVAHDRGRISAVSHLGVCGHLLLGCGGRGEVRKAFVSSTPKHLAIFADLRSKGMDVRGDLAFLSTSALPRCQSYNG